MKIIIATGNDFKYSELEKYFKDIGLSVERSKKNTIKEVEEEFLEKSYKNEDYIIVQEKSKLINNKNEKALLEKVERCTHKSKIIMKYTKVNPYKEIINEYEGEVEGFVFPFLRKETKEYIYGWDDVFISKNTSQTNQEMKMKGIKNSARDIAFSLMIEDLAHYFYFEKPIKLNFNEVECDGVISFEPFIRNLLLNEDLYKVAYKNDFFKPLLNKVLNDGLFMRSAKTRQQKNYWLPGVNAGIPLTPKKDNVHELTFMFHDMMHFLFPDLILTKDDNLNKKVYIIYRMMSEAFTLVLADALYVHLIKESDIQYDFSKRKIYDLFATELKEVSLNNKKQIYDLLRMNADFALLGKEEDFCKLNKEAFELYKSKYQNFFNQDYIWTNQNCENLAKNVDVNKIWYKECKENGLLNVLSTEEFARDLQSENTKDVFNYTFERFISRLEKSLLVSEYEELNSLKNAYKKYMAGQIMIFFKYENNYNVLFKNNILELLKDLESSKSIEEVNSVYSEIKDSYSLYLETLVEDNLITKYKASQYNDIYPLFDPYFVFYDKDKQDSFKETLGKIFKDLN